MHRKPILPIIALLLLVIGRAGAADFPTFTAYDIGQGGNLLAQTSLVDIDHDGDLDWIVGEQGSNNAAARVWWYEYQAPGTWVQHLIGTNPLTDVGGTAFDVDGDGWVDEVTAGAWFKNPGPATGTWTRYAVGGITNSHDCVAVDMDGDGKLDLVAMSDSGGLWWYKIPADPTQPWIQHRIGDGVHGGISPHGVGDINGDGMPDIVRSTGWFENVGHGASWIWHGNIPAGHPAPYTDCTKSWIVDMDKDGDMDVVISSADIDNPNGQVRWFENLDGKGLSWKEHIIATGKGDLHTLALADFDNDGDLDIFSGEGPSVGGPKGTGANGAFRWFVWENLDGKGGSWAEHIVYEGPIECHEGKAADVDGDGAIDICSKPWYGSQSIFLKNNLAKPASAPPAAPANLSASAPSWSQIHLTWTDNANNESGFKVETANAAGGPWTQIATVGANAVGYDHTGLAGATTRWYRIRATNSAGDSSYTNVASATTAAPPPANIPLNGLSFWVSAGTGVVKNGSTVAQWTDQSGNSRNAVQATAGSQPLLVASVLNGKSVIRFDGVDDCLQVALPINGLTAMTVVLVSAATVDHDGGANGGDNAALFWDETAGWGWTFLSPFQSAVKLRFGTTQAANLSAYARPATIAGAFSVTIAKHDGATDSLYVNGAQVWSAGGKLAAVAGTANTASIGRGAGATCFAGDIAEILVYGRALGDSERQGLESFYQTSYALPGAPSAGPIDTTPPATPAAPTVSGAATARPTFSGTTEAGATVTIYSDGVRLGSTTANGSGAWTWTPSVDLSAGVHHITANATDGAGNVSSMSPAVMVTVAVAPPAGGSGGGTSSGTAGGGGHSCGVGSGFAMLAVGLGWIGSWSWRRRG